MKRNLVQLLARPVTTYVTAAIAAVLIVCTVITGIFAVDSVLLRILTVLLSFFTAVFGLLSWFAYVLHTRRATQQLNRRLHQELYKHFMSLEQRALQSQETILKELTAAQRQHLDEYQKQAYHTQISLQELRLAALNERE